MVVTNSRYVCNIASAQCIQSMTLKGFITLRVVAIACHAFFQLPWLQPLVRHLENHLEMSCYDEAWGSHKTGSPSDFLWKWVGEPNLGDTGLNLVITPLYFELQCSVTQPLLKSRSPNLFTAATQHNCFTHFLNKIVNDWRSKPQICSGPLAKSDHKDKHNY